MTQWIKVKLIKIIEVKISYKINLQHNTHSMNFKTLF